MYIVTLYYQFAPIKNVKQFWADHRRECKRLNLLGRIYVSKEGINGTLAGTPKEISNYQLFLKDQQGFESTDFKDDRTIEMPFRKLIVRIRNEIVSLKSSVSIDPSKEHGKYLEPEEWKAILDSKDDVTLLDVRNNYESAIGYFKGAIKPDVENFFDFEEWVDRTNFEKDKKVLMYCTGGIRCEKFSLLMEKKGFQHVRQLHGGIIKYAQTIGDDHYKGKCFVFDDRLTVPIEKNQKEPIGKCAITGISCDRYINCANLDCNKLFLCSPEGAKEMEGCCSDACKKSTNRRPFDPNNIYAPTLKKYLYEEKPEFSLAE